MSERPGFKTLRQAADKAQNAAPHPGVSIGLTVTPEWLQTVDDLKRHYGLNRHADVLELAVCALASIAVGDGDMFYVPRGQEYISCLLPLDARRNPNR